MDVDQVTYIFGSFSRRRQGEEPSSKRRSQGPKSPGPGSPESRHRCVLCRRPFVEPRVLPCLHTFCTRCLLRLHPPKDTSGTPWNGEGESDVAVNGRNEESTSRSGSGSGGSGYESEPRDMSSDGSWKIQYHVEKSPKKIPRQYGIYNKKISGTMVQILICPICSSESKLPSGGILALPPNFVLQHRMFVAALNKDTSRLLCDLCSSDVPALSRCTTCLVSLCGGCREAHVMQRHSLMPLAEAARRGALTLRRQPLCPRHPENELKLFCTTCCQVICRDCCLVQHNGHSFDAVSRAAESYIRSIREAVDRVKPVIKQTTSTIENLQQAERHIQIKCSLVQNEVEEFIDSYIRAVEEHRQILQLQVLKARDIKIQSVANHQLQLEKHAENVSDAVQFAEDILAEGTDVEVLSFVGPLLRRLEWCSNTDGLFETIVSENLKLLKEEKSCLYGSENLQLYGIISTQNVEPNLCTIDPKTLKGARVHQSHDVIIETRDTTGQPLCRGGEKVEGFIRKPGLRPKTVTVQDKRDGSYSLRFVPDSPGNFQLVIHINGKPIKSSPFVVPVRNLKPHTGKWHCCTFCSSGGSKEAECACGGHMAGGYRGCGHGHEGHPGTRHWSCCANTQHNSDCTRTNSTIYQFSL